jgi:hypothetical protein
VDLGVRGSSPRGGTNKISDLRTHDHLRNPHRLLIGCAGGQAGRPTRARKTRLLRRGSAGHCRQSGSRLGATSDSLRRLDCNAPVVRPSWLVQAQRERGRRLAWLGVPFGLLEPPNTSSHQRPSLPSRGTVSCPKVIPFTGEHLGHHPAAVAGSDVALNRPQTILMPPSSLAKAGWRLH